MTISHEKVVQDINAILHGLGQKKVLELVRLKIKSTQIASEEAVWSQLQALAPATGWWLRQSSQSHWKSGDPLQPEARNALLAGEWAGDGYAVRIQSEGAFWRFTEMTESSEGEPMLVSQQQLLASNGEVLNYKVYSRQTENGTGIQAVAFALMNGAKA